MSRLLRVLRSLTLTAGAALGTVCIVWTVGLAASGLTPLVFMSGSMAPAIDTGAVGFAQEVPAADVEPGDVVSVTATDGTRITHRVVSSTPNGSARTLVLQGDANDAPDVEQYVVDTVDRVVADLPHAGYVVSAMSSPWGVGGSLTLMLACLVLVGRHPRTDWDGATPGPARHRARTGDWRRGAVATLGVTVLGLGVAGTLLAPVVGTLAYLTDSPAVQSSANGLTSAPALTCAQNVAGFAPYAYYAMNETSGTAAVDSSGNNRAASYHQGADISVAGVTKSQTSACGRGGGTAVLFNNTLEATASYISTAANAWSDNGTGTNRWNTFTVSAWFKTASQTSTGKIIGFGSSSSGASASYDRHVYLNTDGRLVFGVYPGSIQTVTAPGDYSDQRWHQVTATLSSAGMALYVDGALVVRNESVTSAQQNFSNAAGYWRIGYDNLGSWPDGTHPAFGAVGAASSAFAGTIDEAAVWTRALSADEVRDLYRSALPLPAV